MSAHAVPREYACEVVAAGAVYGTNLVVPHRVSAYRTAEPERALAWLRGEALRIADLLDPDPVRSVFWVTECEELPVPDAPTELRYWATDLEEQAAATARVGGGRSFSTVVPDVGCRWNLIIWPMAVGPPGHRPGMQPPISRPGRASHRKARRTSGWLTPFNGRDGLHKDPYKESF